MYLLLAKGSRYDNLLAFEYYHILEGEFIPDIIISDQTLGQVSYLATAFDH